MRIVAFQALLLSLVAAALQVDGFACPTRCLYNNFRIVPKKPTDRVTFLKIASLPACIKLMIGRKIKYYGYLSALKACFGFKTCASGTYNLAMSSGVSAICARTSPRRPPVKRPPPPPPIKTYCSSTVGEKCTKGKCPSWTRCEVVASGARCCCPPKKPNPVIKGGKLKRCKK